MLSNNKDAEKQDAINLFLGNYQPSRERANYLPWREKIPLWDLDNDFYLHNDHPLHSIYPKRSYRNWVTPQSEAGTQPQTITADDYFTEYYRPRVYTSFKRLFSFNMLGTNTKGPLVKDVISPFVVRVNPQHQQKQFMMYTLNIGGVKRWLALDKEPGEEEEDEAGNDSGVLEGREYMESPAMMEGVKLEVTDDQEWYGTAALSTRLLQPQVPETELKEYERYTTQFKNNSKSTYPQNYGYYAGYIGDVGVGEVKERDEGVYVNYCGMMEGRGWKRTVKKEASYRGWMETGVYVLPKKPESRFVRGVEVR
jgi:hypothetical protein